MTPYNFDIFDPLPRQHAIMPYVLCNRVVSMTYLTLKLFVLVQWSILAPIQALQFFVQLCNSST